MSIIEMIKKCVFKEKADADSYFSYLRNKGMKIGERVVTFRPRSLTIDETRPWLIEIGNDVQIANGVSILTHGYDWSVLKGKYGNILGSSGKVKIGNNVFIGINSIILKGVTIGDNTIIGAGSVVSRDIPGNCVAAGNPAKVLMSLDDYFLKRSRAQYDEAAELVRNYREIYKEEPGDEALSEFFWLFTNNDQDLPDAFEEKMCLVGNREQSGESLRNHTLMFNSKEEFLKSIT